MNAKTCHEANRALQIEQNDPTPSPAWEGRKAKDAVFVAIVKALS